MTEKRLHLSSLTVWNRQAMAGIVHGFVHDFISRRWGVSKNREVAHGYTRDLLN